MTNRHLEEMVDEFQRRLEHVRSKTPRVRSRELFAEIKVKYFRRLLEAKEQGEPIVWTMWSAPSELITALDLVAFIPEQFSIQLLSMGKGLDYIDRAEAYGVGRENCRSHTCTIGMALADQTVPPDCLISSTVPCDSYLATYEVAANLYKCPVVYLHPPINTGDKLRDRAGVEYYRQQLEQALDLLERHTGRKADWQRLKDVVQTSLRSHNYHARIQQELRKAVPCPLSAREGISSFGILHNCRGWPEVLEYYEVLYQETRDKVAAGFSPIAEEKYRVGWLGALPYWSLTILDWMKREHNTEVPLDLLNIVPEPEIPDTVEPLEGIARRVQGYPAVRAAWPYETWREEAINACREFRLDAMVIYAHFGCIYVTGFNRMMKEDLEQHLKIPTLVLDGDPVDPRVASIEEQMRRLDEFLVTMVKR